MRNFAEADRCALGIISLQYMYCSVSNLSLKSRYFLSLFLPLPLTPRSLHTIWSHFTLKVSSFHYVCNLHNHLLLMDGLYCSVSNLSLKSRYFLSLFLPLPLTPRSLLTIWSHFTLKVSSFHYVCNLHNLVLLTDGLASVFKQMTVYVIQVSFNLKWPVFTSVIA